MCVNIIIVVESYDVNFNNKSCQCAEIQCINRQLSICDVQFKVVTNIQGYFPCYLISYILR